MLPDSEALVYVFDGSDQGAIKDVIKALDRFGSVHTKIELINKTSQHNKERGHDCT